MWDFWERRIRRIFPAAMVMVVITMIVALCWPGFVLLPEEFEQLGKTAIAQALMVANIYFWKATGNYFSEDAESSPFLHTWSLAVEEHSLSHIISNHSCPKPLKIDVNLWINYPVFYPQIYADLRRFF